LATNGLTVQSILGSFGLLLGLIGDEGVSLSAVVSIKNLSKLFKFSLELFTGGSDGNSVDEEFAILGDVDVVGGHLGYEWALTDSTDNTPRVLGKAYV